MNLELTKIVAFALDIESYQGAMGKQPALVLEVWEGYYGYQTLTDLWADLPAHVSAKLRNYELIWAKELGGLTEAVDIAGYPTPPTLEGQQSEKSESVIKESEE